MARITEPTPAGCRGTAADPTPATGTVSAEAAASEASEGRPPSGEIALSIDPRWTKARQAGALAALVFALPDLPQTTLLRELRLPAFSKADEEAAVEGGDPPSPAEALASLARVPSLRLLRLEDAGPLDEAAASAIFGCGTGPEEVALGRCTLSTGLARTLARGANRVVLREPRLAIGTSAGRALAGLLCAAGESLTLIRAGFLNRNAAEEAMLYAEGDGPARLSLRACAGVDDPFLRALAPWLRGTKVLRLRDCHTLRGRTLACLHKSVSLEQLDLRGTAFEKQALPQIMSLLHLRRLDLESGGVTLVQEALRVLEGHPSLDLAPLVAASHRPPGAAMRRRTM